MVSARGVYRQSCNMHPNKTAARAANIAVLALISSACIPLIREISKVAIWHFRLCSPMEQRLEPFVKIAYQQRNSDLIRNVA